VRVLQVIPGEEHGPAYIFIKRQVDALERAGVALDRFFLESRTSARLLQRELHRFKNRVREYKPDMVHAQYGTMTSFFCMAGWGGPLVVSLRGSDVTRDYDISRVREVVGHVLTHISSVRAEGLICVSRNLVDGLWFKSARRRAVIIPSAVDIELFKPMPKDEARRALGWGLEEKIAVFNIGRAPARKRLDLAQGAVAVARKKYPKLRLATMNIDVPGDQVPLWMNAGDCLLMTSDAEGSPNVVKEAMACNLPVVSVDVGDVRERLAGVDPSRIVARDPEALGAAVIEILDMNRRSNSREAVVKDLTEDVMVRRVLEVYRDALSKRGGQHG